MNLVGIKRKTKNVTTLILLINILMKVRFIHIFEFGVSQLNKLHLYGCDSLGQRGPQTDYNYNYSYVNT